jgi:short-subunit dehydrogenase
VTGAAREEGIGFGFARHLAGKHLNLVLVDILSEELEQRAKELRAKYHVKVEVLAHDLGDPAFLPELRELTDRVDVGLLVCNHMFMRKDTPPILEMELDEHLQILDVNARAYMQLVHVYGRDLVARGRGGIVIVSSQAGFRGMPYTGAYSANKAYQLMLGESLWYELRGTGVDVTVLTPGLTNTQGDGLDGYPKAMIMEVDPVVAEALRGLGKRHLVVPGLVNKVFQASTNLFMTRRRALLVNGGVMARGLGKH